jgi:erythronate-4-phosphate dehydrogenase
MKVVSDKYLYRIEEMLPGNVELIPFDPGNALPEDVTSADALLIRTVTKINSGTLPEAGKLKFVGTATAGFDHVDTDHLESLGIAFGHSPGCNARAVGEYVITAIYLWAEKHGLNPETGGVTVGVVGCGHTGSAVIELLGKLGIRYLQYDPPRAERDHGFESVSEDELMSADILTFHVPLTRSGEHATHHLCNSSWLENGFRLIINAARGGVVDEQALIEALNRNKVGEAVIDVWENEPVFSDEMAAHSMIGTPHIAGYSRESKLRASRLVIEEMCRVLALEPVRQLPGEPFDKKLILDPDMGFAGFLRKNNQIEVYDHDLRKLIGLPGNEKGRLFAKLRAETPTRFEYGTILRAAENRDNIPELCRVFL